MIKPIIAANWKMNKTIGEAAAFARELKGSLTEGMEMDLVLAPPFTALSRVAEILGDSPISLAAQNIHEAPEGKGAFTGEISAAMLVDAGCKLVIVGHSERRTLFGETDERINEKLLTALRYRLKPIFCVGESLNEREKGKAFRVIEGQLKEGLKNVVFDDTENVIIAYEPVWAIGTGRTATPGQAEEIHRYIRDFMAEYYGSDLAARLPVIYGGSVNPDNMAALMAEKDINGVLVGGASLKIDSFLGIVNYQ